MRRGAVVLSAALLAGCPYPSTEDCERAFTFHRDADGDGYGVEDDTETLRGCSDAGPPEGYVAPRDDEGDDVLEWDCDDADGSRHPNAAEVCDGLDQDCNAIPDEGVTVDRWPDLDGDGFGDRDADAVPVCPDAPGAVDNADDCDDTDRDVNPAAAGDATCDGRDDDCDGDADEDAERVLGFSDEDGDGDGVGDAYDPQVLGCPGAPNFSLTATDCAPQDPTRAGTLPEICDDGIDNDCFGADPDYPDNLSREPLDRADGSPFWGDSDGDLVGAEGTDPAWVCATRIRYETYYRAPTAGDCDDLNPSVPTVVEVCADGRDDDCNGRTDEGFGLEGGIPWYVDRDQDGFGDDGYPQVVGCAATIGTRASLVGGDCDDASPYSWGVYPGAPDPLGGGDTNCDGVDGTDADGDRVAVEAGDCDDAEARIPSTIDACETTGFDESCALGLAARCTDWRAVGVATATLAGDGYALPEAGPVAPVGGDELVIGTNGSPPGDPDELLVVFPVADDLSDQVVLRTPAGADRGDVLGVPLGNTQHGVVAAVDHAFFTENLGATVFFVLDPAPGQADVDLPAATTPAVTVVEIPPDPATRAGVREGFAIAGGQLFGGSDHELVVTAPNIGADRDALWIFSGSGDLAFPDGVDGADVAYLTSNDPTIDALGADVAVSTLPVDAYAGPAIALAALGTNDRNAVVVIDPAVALTTDDILLADAIVYRAPQRPAATLVPQVAWLDVDDDADEDLLFASYDGTGAALYVVVDPSAADDEDLTVSAASTIELPWPTCGGAMAPLRDADPVVANRVPRVAIGCPEYPLYSGTMFVFDLDPATGTLTEDDAAQVLPATGVGGFGTGRGLAAIDLEGSGELALVVTSDLVPDAFALASEP